MCIIMKLMKKIYRKTKKKAIICKFNFMLSQNLIKERTDGGAGANVEPPDKVSTACRSAPGIPGRLAWLLLLPINPMDILHSTSSFQLPKLEKSHMQCPGGSPGFPSSTG